MLKSCPPSPTDSWTTTPGLSGAIWWKISMDLSPFVFGRPGWGSGRASVSGRPLERYTVV